MIRVRILQTISSAITVLALIFTASQTHLSAVANARVANVQAVESISDDELLKGLIYGQGPVADKIGLYVTLPPELSEEEYLKAVEYSIEEMKIKYPDEVREVLMALRDDDPIVVESALDAMASIAMEYEEYKLRGRNVDKSPSACGVAVVCVAYAAAAVHNTVAVTGLAVVVVGGAVVAGKWRWVGKGSSAPLVVREELVSDLISIT